MADAPSGLGRLKVLLIFLLFFGPTIGAWVLIESGWRPGGTVNRGQLLRPVEPMAEVTLVDANEHPVAAASFRGHWTVLVSAASACVELCQQTLDLVGRVHVALNKDMARVRIGLVLPPRESSPQLPEQILRLHAPAAQLQAWADGAAGSEGGIAVHIVDYRGLRMMAYPVPLDASGLLKDLRRLLRLSSEEAERRELGAEVAR